MKSYSGLVGPQNPLITLLKKKRETKLTPVYATDEPQVERNGSCRYEPVIETDHKTIFVNFNRGQTKTTAFKPMSIHQYEPGQSSIVKSEDLHEPKEYNPPICKPGDLCNYSGNADSQKFQIKKRSESQINYSIQNNVQLSKGESNSETHFGNEERSLNMYKDIMRGGDIPKEGLKSYVEIRKVRTLPNTSTKDSNGSLSTIEETLNQAVSDLQLSTSLISSNNDSSFDSSSYSKPSKARLEKEMEILARRNEVERVVDLERRRMKEKEVRRNAERRHNDFLLPIEKYPVRLNRYDNGTEGPLKASGDSSSYGIAMYNFIAKSSRELTMVKGDRVNIVKRVDRNWWEAEKAGDVGIVPVTYVKLMKEISDLRMRPPSSSPSRQRRRHMQGRVLFDFETNYPSELPVKKGERLSILRQLDADWVEVRSRNGEGAVPSSYIQPITNEYDDDVIRSVSSRTVTPIFDPHERLETVSPIESVFSVLSHAPTIPSAPHSPVGSQHSIDLSGDWPTLEASLASLQQKILHSNIKEVNDGRYTPQHQIQHQQVHYGRYTPQHQIQRQQVQKQQEEKQELIERYNSILRKQRQHQMTSPAITKQQQLQQQQLQQQQLQQQQLQQHQLQQHQLQQQAQQKRVSTLTRIHHGSVIKADDVNDNNYNIYKNYRNNNISTNINNRLIDNTTNNKVTIQAINNKDYNKAIGANYNTNKNITNFNNTNNSYNKTNNNYNNNMTRSSTSEFSKHSQTIFTSPERFIDQHNSINNIENKGYFESKASVLSNSQYNSNASNNLYNTDNTQFNVKPQYNNRTFNQINDNRFNTIQNNPRSNNHNQRYMSNIDNINNIENNNYNRQYNYNSNNNRNTYNSTRNITEKEVITLKPIKLHTNLPPDYSRLYSSQRDNRNKHNNAISMDRNSMRGSMILNRTPLNDRYTSSSTVQNSRVDLNTSFNSNYNENLQNTLNTPRNKYIDTNRNELSSNHINDVSSIHSNSTANLTANKRHSNVIITTSDRLVNAKNQSRITIPQNMTHSLTNESSSRYRNNYRVLNEYMPMKADELMLSHGDVIRVVEKCRDGWWVGASTETGNMGIFPGNHLIPM